MGAALCPRCGAFYKTPPSISRADDRTLICPGCGVEEALEAYVKASERFVWKAGDIRWVIPPQGETAANKLACPACGSRRILQPIGPIRLGRHRSCLRCKHRF